MQTAWDRLSVIAAAPLCNRALGNRALGNRALGNRALGNRTPAASLARNLA